MNEVKQLNIKNAEAYRLAAELAERSGDSITAVVVAALREKADRDLHAIPRNRKGIAARLMALSAISSSWPDKDTRSADEILGYDENGLPS
jgi:antitoxin VapB